ncbi:MAG: hypothetical protein WDN06_18775 [Asticcacaulis sp.]
MLGKAESQLDIKPANSSSKMEFVAGPDGRDALAGLGLAAGVVTSDANKTMDASSTGYLKSQKGLGLDFDSSLNLNSDANIKTAMDALNATMKNVQKAYNYLKYGDPQPQHGHQQGQHLGRGSGLSDGPDRQLPGRPQPPARHGLIPHHDPPSGA